MHYMLLFTEYKNLNIKYLVVKIKINKIRLTCKKDGGPPHLSLITRVCILQTFSTKKHLKCSNFHDNKN